jgi:hypothetical protein
LVTEGRIDRVGCGITVIKVVVVIEEHPSETVKVYIVDVVGHAFKVVVLIAPGIHVYVDAQKGLTMVALKLAQLP